MIWRKRSSESLINGRSPHQSSRWSLFQLPSMDRGRREEEEGEGQKGWEWWVLMNLMKQNHYIIFGVKEIVFQRVWNIFFYYYILYYVVLYIQNMTLHGVSSKRNWKYWIMTIFLTSKNKKGKYKSMFLAYITLFILKYDYLTIFLNLYFKFCIEMLFLTSKQNTFGRRKVHKIIFVLHWFF